MYNYTPVDIIYRKKYELLRLSLLVSASKRLFEVHEIPYLICGNIEFVDLFCLTDAYTRKW